mmetsp:Transcript_11561/g.41241  ORF Transcript_11561/g.41241 Transcript_11561/m.41241 type:complete len:272 (+) Transcript_11561:870-1685(+)
MHGSDMCELVGNPAPNILTVVVAAGAEPPEVGLPGPDAVQAGLQLEGRSLRVITCVPNGQGEPQNEDGCALEDHEPWCHLAVNQVLQHLVFLTVRPVDLRLDDVIQIHIAVFVKVPSAVLHLFLLVPLGLPGHLGRYLGPRGCRGCFLLLALLLARRGGAQAALHLDDNWFAVGVLELELCFRLLRVLLLRGPRLLEILHQKTLISQVSLDVLGVKVTVAIHVEAVGAEPVGEEEHEIVRETSATARLHRCLRFRFRFFSHLRLCPRPDEG